MNIVQEAKKLVKVKSVRVETFTTTSQIATVPRSCQGRILRAIPLVIVLEQEPTLLRSIISIIQNQLQYHTHRAILAERARFAVRRKVTTVKRRASSRNVSRVASYGMSPLIPRHKCTTSRVLQRTNKTRSYHQRKTWKEHFQLRRYRDKCARNHLDER